jgi:hypothetical protein
MYLQKNLIHILCFLEIKELNNEDDMGQFTYSPIATPSWISRLTQCIMGDPG